MLSSSPIPIPDRGSSGSWSPSNNNVPVTSRSLLGGNLLAKLPMPIVSRNRSFSNENIDHVVGSPLKRQPSPVIQRMQRRSGSWIDGDMITPRPQFDILEIQLHFPQKTSKILKTYAALILSELNAYYGYIHAHRMIVVLPISYSQNLISVGSKISNVLWRASATDPLIIFDSKTSNISGEFKNASLPISMHFDISETLLVKQSGIIVLEKIPDTVDKVNNMILLVDQD